jgi:hypothetical protein
MSQRVPGRDIAFPFRANKQPVTFIWEQRAGRAEVVLSVFGPIYRFMISSKTEAPPRSQKREFPFFGDRPHPRVAQFAGAIGLSEQMFGAE